MRKVAVLLTAGFLAFVSISAYGLAESVQLFTNETEAQKHCPADTVVWLNTPTGIYHFKGMRWYGNTNHGAYVCQKGEEWQ
jgi:hypothetical protein